MVELTIDNFDLKQIADSGQCFRWYMLKDGVCNIFAFGKYLMVEQNKNKFKFFCSQEDFDTIWKDYFDLCTDYQTIINSIPKDDAYLLKCAERGYGIRILKQDLWETIVTFIISQRKSIPAIRTCIERICSYTKNHRFPNPTELYVILFYHKDQLGLGYRYNYLLELSKKCMIGEYDYNKLKEMEYNEVIKELMKIKGVGIKIALCIALFGLGLKNSFPVDVHINNILSREYPNGFNYDKYYGNLGYFQQIMFYNEINK